jgi:hypothetical protein
VTPGYGHDGYRRGILGGLKRNPPVFSDSKCRARRESNAIC